MIYCTLLNPALDVIYKVNDFRSGSTFTDIPLAMYPAGKGINVANVVKTLGEEVCVTGLMPEYDLKRTTQYLDHLQIQHNFFVIPGNLRINTTIIEQNTGFVSHISSASAPVGLRVQHDFLSFFSSLPVAGDWWSFSGSVIRGFDEDIYATMLRLCIDAGSETLLDTRGAALKTGIRAKPLMIKPNLSELEDFFSEQIQGVHHIALKGKRFIDMGIPYVFISLGADGLMAIHENDCLLCSAPQLTAVDTVGCGDALVAGIMVARKRKFSFSELCRMAVACGSSKAMHEGPGAITRNEVWQLMEDVKITSV
ncbi:MAG TPA: hexose kinase [Chitinispirillaceae bacterium]|nr:hexose kinase [Chitinispirillaceae bacterium]